MRKVTVIGLGDMGSGLAKNLITAGFEVSGFDLSAERLARLKQMGGKATMPMPSINNLAALGNVGVLACSRKTPSGRIHHWARRPRSH